MRVPNYVHKHFNPMRAKTLRKQLALTIRRNFPHVGGQRMTELCADIVLEIVARHLHPRDHIGHGQLLWLGIDIDDPPSRHKTSANTRLVPVVLDLWTDDDLQAILDGESPSQRLLKRCIRLHEQAHQQGALLSNVDLACMLAVSDTRVSHLLAAYERDHDTVVPRRATLHDVGTGVTHKRIICRKRYVEGKTPDVIARETHHSLGAVDRYLGAFDRVRYCLRQGMNVDQIAQTLNRTGRLVQQYVEIDNELKGDNT